MDKTQDWSDSAADSIVGLADQVREKVTKPFKPTARLLAYIPLLALFLCGLIALLTIGIFRLVDAYLSQPTWLAHYILGVVFVLAGLVLWFKRPKFTK